MTKPQAPSANGNIQAISELARQSLTAMSGAYASWLQDAGKVQAETVRFLNERFEKDMDLLTQFAHCRRPEEIAALQSKAFATLVSDYAHESQTLFGLLGTLSTRSIEQVQKLAVPPSPR